MNGGLEVWRQRLALWLPALLFVLANVALLSAYRLAVWGRLASLETDIASTERTLEARRGRRATLERALDDAQATRRDVSALYTERLGTEAERLTALMAEVKRLARQAGMQPRVISYPVEELDDFGLVRQSWVFGVEGTYGELRQFVNFLELTDSFLTLEEIGLTEGGGGTQLRINLRLSTLFDARGEPR